MKAITLPPFEEVMSRVPYWRHLVVNMKSIRAAGQLDGAFAEKTIKLTEDYLKRSGTVYVARYCKRGDYCFAGHSLANPFPLKYPSKDNSIILQAELGGHSEERIRRDLLAKYYEWLNEQPELVIQIAQLQGMKLACWCAPDLCHAMILAVLANDERHGLKW